MQKMLTILLSTLFVAMVIAAAAGLLVSKNAEASEISNWQGPRIGFTYLDNSMLEEAADNDVELSHMISQFGYQFEKSLFTTKSGAQGSTALIPLIGAADQGEFLPSLTWVMGFRSGKGWEVAAGPNLSVSGIGMAYSVGRTFTFDEVHTPLNFVIVSSDNGVRASLLFGFNVLSE